MTAPSKSLTPEIRDAVREWVSAGYGLWIVDLLIQSEALHVVGPQLFTTERQS